MDDVDKVAAPSLPAAALGLLPCPFCAAGTTQVRENGRIWTGTKYGAPITVSVMHWCEQVAGQPSRMIERIGRDHDSALAAWNTRSP